MAPSKIIVWICGDCSFRNEGNHPGPCLICNMPHPKRKAVVALAAPAAALAVVSLALAKCAQKSGQPAPRTPPGLVLNIVGIDVGDWESHYKDHMVCCGKVVEEDIVVHLRKERTLVPNFLTGKRKTREETAITVNRVMDNVDCCCVGFLLRAYALDGAIYNGVLCQVTEVFEKNDPSCTICKKWHKHKGFARAAVIFASNKCVLCKGGEERVVAGGMNDDYLS